MTVFTAASVGGECKRRFGWESTAPVSELLCSKGDGEPAAVGEGVMADLDVATLFVPVPEGLVAADGVEPGHGAACSADVLFGPREQLVSQPTAPAVVVDDEQVDVAGVLIIGAPDLRVVP